jgi:hypothetical protein
MGDEAGTQILERLAAGDVIVVVAAAASPS